MKTTFFFFTMISLTLFVGCQTLRTEDKLTISIGGRMIEPRAQAYRNFDQNVPIPNIKVGHETLQDRVDSVKADAQKDKEVVYNAKRTMGYYPDDLKRQSENRRLISQTLDGNFWKTLKIEEKKSLVFGFVLFIDTMLVDVMYAATFDNPMQAKTDLFYDAKTSNFGSAHAIDFQGKSVNEIVDFVDNYYSMDIHLDLSISNAMLLFSKGRKAEWVEKQDELWVNHKENESEPYLE